MAHDAFSLIDTAGFLARAGLTADSVFTDPRIVIWRSLADRENGYLDLLNDDESVERFHIKRYPSQAGQTVEKEITGYLLLHRAGVPCAQIVAHGRCDNGGGFVILADLAQFKPADKLLESGLQFERILAGTALLTAKLHRARLHHRDLYLCHFMVQPRQLDDLRLIDLTRVARLKNPLTRRRWIIKDLAQFWYSTLKLPITDDQRRRWLELYQQQFPQPTPALRRAVERKASRIARHDQQLNSSQPGRNVSIPT